MSGPFTFAIGESGGTFNDGGGDTVASGGALLPVGVSVGLEVLLGEALVGALAAGSSVFDFGASGASQPVTATSRARTAGTTSLPRTRTDVSCW